MNKMACAVLGAGFVGGNLATTLAERGLNVYQFDKSGKKSRGTNARTFLSIHEMVSLIADDEGFSGVVFVCVPSPMIQSTGECDTSIVESALRDLAYAANGKQLVAVVKSTVPPGSCERWNKMFIQQGLSVCHSPEFLREANAKLDTETQSGRIVIGGDELACEKAKAVFNKAFPDVPVYLTTSAVSEMSKYVANCFLACKVIFANEMFQICKKADINYDEMIGLATLDPRLGKSHWQVPGPMPCDATGKPAYGFGGSCFSKDINGLAYYARKLGLVPMILETAWKKNKMLRPQQDWKKLEGRAVSKRKSPLTVNVYSIAKEYVQRNGKPFFDKLLGS